MTNPPATSGTLNQITDIVIGTAIEIHRRLGPGLLESVYCTVLAHELRKKNLRVDVEVSIPVFWGSIQMEIGFRADMIIEGLVILEIKSVEKPRLFTRSNFSPTFASPGNRSDYSSISDAL